ncbi:MAG: DUF882 domain-containing protein [Nitrospirota bacterium]
MISRRNFIKAIAAATAFYPFRDVIASGEGQRSLNLCNIHTDERLDITYFYAGRYDYEALSKLNYLLRCHYTNEVRPIDINVLDLLCEIKERIDRNAQIQVISGYRSPEYNDYLASLGRHVSRNSYHMKGLALDFSIEGVSNNALSDIARSLASGGVGKYPEFVHIDVGPIRYW